MQQRTAAMRYFALLALANIDESRANKLQAFLDKSNGWDENLPHTVAERLRVSAKEVTSAFQRVGRSFDELPEDTEIVHRDKPEFSSLLRETRDCPEFLFCRGNIDLLSKPTVAVVGTRKASTEGKQRGQKLSALLAKAGIVVASGLAKGVDRAAHSGALQAGGDTISVIGTPLHRSYPPEHKDLQTTIAEEGLVVSQFAPAFPVRRWFFPKRNAVMSGISAATVVIEASETSGAVIQAKQCLRQGRMLFLPESLVNNTNFQWPRKLLRFPKAHAFSSVSELLDMINETVDLTRSNRDDSEPRSIAKVFHQIWISDVR